MAVAPMSKAQIMIHGDASAEVVKRIYDLGVLHVIEIVEPPARDVELQGLADEMNDCLAEFESRLHVVTRALSILADYDDAKRPVIENFVTLKERLPRQTLEEVRAKFDFRDVSAQLQTLAETLKRALDEEHRLREAIRLLHTLAPLPFSLGELDATTRANVLIGQIRKEAKPALLEALTAFEDRIHLEDIAEAGPMCYLLILYLPVESSDPCDAILSVLEQQSFDRLDLSAYTRRCPEEIGRLTGELTGVQAQITQLQQQIRDFLPYKAQFRMIEDQVLNEIARCKNFENFAETANVYFVEGWLKQRDQQRLTEDLREFEALTEIIYTPAESTDETVPVLFDNPRWLQPFELVTQMFGMPKYHEPDPTPLLAPFFLIYFGLCLTDAGYGIMLSILMAWLLRRYIMGDGAQRLARLLLYGGLATIVCGALTGGWWGDLFNALPPAVVAAKDRLILVDPVKQPLIFLAGALGLGYIQICYGIFLKFLNRWRNGDKLAALQEDGNWFVLINSVFFFAVLSAAGVGASAFGQGLLQIVKIIAVLSAALRVWMTRRDVANIPKRLVLGILGLYDLTGIFSDVLSYSRLLALGLSSGVIAVLINMVAKMLAESIPILGIALGLIIFLGGHVFNLVISVLGGFIHTARLQFLEFFSKFYESGGRRYIPFRFESKYFEIVE